MGVALAVKVTTGDPIYCVEEKEKIGERDRTKECEERRKGGRGGVSTNFNYDI